MWISETELTNWTYLNRKILVFEGMRFKIQAKCKVKEKQIAVNQIWKYYCEYQWGAKKRYIFDIIEWEWNFNEIKNEGFIYSVKGYP